jgi:hypothetical protein
MSNPSGGGMSAIPICKVSMLAAEPSKRPTTTAMMFLSIGFMGIIFIIVAKCSEIFQYRYDLSKF